jgi:predicted protein tyrosine phosphatase
LVSGILLLLERSSELLSVVADARMGPVPVTNVLFLCSRNRRRSPTGERIFADREGIETDSSGLAPDAEVAVSLDQLQWADLVVVMEKKHRSALTRRFGRHLARTRVVCLDIPDRYDFMDPELVILLERKMAKFL